MPFTVATLKEAIDKALETEGLTGEDFPVEVWRGSSQAYTVESVVFDDGCIVLEVAIDRG